MPCFLMCQHGRTGEAACWELPVSFLVSRYGEALACLVNFSSAEMLLIVWTVGMALCLLQNLGSASQPFQL